MDAYAGAGWRRSHASWYAGGRAGIIILTTFQDDANVFSAFAERALTKTPTTGRSPGHPRGRGRALIHPEITAQVLREFFRLAAQPPSAPAAPATPAPQHSQRLALLTERELAPRILAAGAATRKSASG